MKGEITLNVVMEPQDHFNAEDDSYLGNILSEKRKGPLEVSVILKDDMKDVCKDLMAHWYNLKGAEYDEYQRINFEKKWEVLDNRHAGQIYYEEAKKFIRDYIGGTI
mgnify:CR=1 FL=1